MKKITGAAVVAFLCSFAGIGYADTLSGTVKSVDSGGNSLTIASQRSDTSEMAEHKLVWDDGFAEQQRLENARIGERLTVDAEQNPVTRNWKVQTVRGDLADAEKSFLRTEDQTIGGEITEINLAGHSLTLSSRDASGQPQQHRVVWDESNIEVRNRLEKAKIGDNITLNADKNKLTQNWKAKSVVGGLQAMAEGDIQTLSGQVKQVDADKNYIILNTTDVNGKLDEKKLVWDNDFPQQSRLENARVGEQLTVRADQNMISRNWKVKAIN